MSLVVKHAFVSAIADDPGALSTGEVCPQAHWNAAHDLSGTADAGQLNANVVQGVVNDTNVVGSISGQVLTFSWAGTLAAARLNSNVVQAVSNDTNVTGSIAGQGLTLGWSGMLGLSRGGTAADLSATGGAHQVLKQVSAGAAVTVGQLAASDISGLAASATTDTTNAGNISSGTLAKARGGWGQDVSGSTGLPTFSAGSITFNTLGTGVVTALGVNTGSAGAFVVNGGSLGTPSSGTATNLTGLPISSGLTGAGTGVLAALAVNTGLVGGFLVNSGAPTAAVNAAARAGSFDIWQRLVNGASSIAITASTTAYANDGWYLASGVNQACTVSQVSGIATGSLFAAKVQRNSGQTGTTVLRYAMPLDSDEIANLVGSNVCLSFTLKEGANQSFSHTVGIALYCGTGAPGKRNGSAYTGETSAISTTATSSTTAQRFQATSAAVIPAGTTQMEIQFTVTPSGTAGADDSFTIDDLQLEAVSSSSGTASPFARVPFQQQLAQCQRFLAAFNSVSASAANMAFGNALGTTQMFCVIHLHVPMRARATGVTVSSAAHFNATSGNGTGIALTALAFLTATPDAVSLLGTVASGLTLGQGSALQINSASAQLLFTGAEL